MNRIQKTIWILAIGVGIGLGLVGCRYFPSSYPVTVNTLPVVQVLEHPNVLVSQFYRHLKPRRVVIVVPQSRSVTFSEQEKFAIAFANHLRQFGVADASVAVPTACNTQTIRRGQLDVHQLVAFAQEYNADSVVYCDVTSFSAYSPLHASISISMVDTREAVVLMAIDGVWDMRDNQTHVSFLNHIGRSMSADGRGNKIQVQSPTEFLSFVAHEFASVISRQ